ncbi:uncharacterized protein [Parasteatoda tepidariorum]|uniref:uncharacterized protein n=1 Tax=Parasteatoda tepidariorum TaxID=114398 RepID=UPI0039BCB64B
MTIPRLELSAYLLIVPKIAVLPPTFVNISNLSLSEKIKLADNNWNKPKRIDALLGAELFFELLGTNKIKIKDSQLILIETFFGHVVSGVANNLNSNLEKINDSCFLLVETENLDKALTSFWENEDVNETKTPVSSELNYCNELFENSFYRKTNGKYVVQMPFRKDISENNIPLGDSKQIAEKRLNQLWKRLSSNPAMKELYVSFLKEYELLNHMERIADNSDFDDSYGYFLPHHGVLKPDSKTTKLRVVFDASAKTANDCSLNDLLCKGGVIQDELFSIMLRFRKHIYAFTADIEKMFRQIEILPSQTKFLKILWKNHESKPTESYRLKTVTYGTACAPYLAQKTLQQLAKDEEKDFPLASKVVLEEFYMDDCLTVTSILNECIKLQQDLTELLKRGGMKLHKWCTNFDSQDTELGDFSFDRDNVTKRDVSSQIARLYDPLGLLGPVFSKAKIFMQRLWLHKLDWNEKLPSPIAQEWTLFIKTLHSIETIQVPRYVLKETFSALILHGFADASEKAFGAVIYLQTVADPDESISQLLRSKSRVAPIKTMTIPDWNCLHVYSFQNL